MVGMAYAGVNHFRTRIGDDDLRNGPLRAFDRPQELSRREPPRQAPTGIGAIKFASTFAMPLLRCNAAVFNRTAPSCV